MKTRREFLHTLLMLTFLTLEPRKVFAALFDTTKKDFWVNDVHSRLNKTRVKAIVKPNSLENLQTTVLYAKQKNLKISIAGGHHAMGGQQFLTNGLLIDTIRLNNPLGFNAEQGTITVEAGITWTKLINEIHRYNKLTKANWAIIQKPTGADDISLGGSLSSNIHGRGLRFKPIIRDVESFTLVDANGLVVHCSRKKNYDLFKLAIGGYGLFGIIYSITLRLQKRRQIQRHVSIIKMNTLSKTFSKAINNGYRYGDFQFSIAPEDTNFLNEGILSLYKHIPHNHTHKTTQKQLSKDQWKNLIYNAHTHKMKAYEQYKNHYLKTDGNIYWNDEAQLSTYIQDYHHFINKDIHPGIDGSEIITEIYVPKCFVTHFMNQARTYFINNQINLIYGTIRVIQKEEESFLRWAKDSYLCIIFNIHTKHTPEDIEKSRKAFQFLIDEAINVKGSYYLTYHTFARKDQILACYPQLKEFLHIKKQYDPDEIFQSNWYNQYKAMFNTTE